MNSLFDFQTTGMVHIPVAGSGRLLVGSWWIFTIVVASVYTGNLTAFLSAPSLYVPVNNLNELIKSDMSFGCLTETALHGLILVYYYIIVMV